MAQPQQPPEHPPVRVVLVDDSGIFNEGVAELIAAFDGYVVPYTALNGKELMMQYADKQPPTIALVDMYMPVMDGPETIHWIRAHWPQTKVLAMSFDRSPDVMRKARQAGACGFIPKDVSSGELHEAFEILQRKGSYWHTALLLEHMALGDAKAPAPVVLTSIERVVLDVVCMPDEPTWDMVADRVNRSVPTVATHRTELHKKLGIKSKAGLVSYGRANGYGQGRYHKLDGETTR